MIFMRAYHAYPSCRFSFHDLKEVLSEANRSFDVTNNHSAGIIGFEKTPKIRLSMA
jgi:hypothetical protein